MQFELDTHTHTIASAHAYSTIQEMAQAAAGKGLKLLAINVRRLAACCILLGFSPAIVSL